jgi:hypothetical protein
VPIERVATDTVRAQIHTPCRLRGTGDVEACHPMMGLDRQVMRRVGVEFAVPRSQATPGGPHGRVALRGQVSR